MMLGPVLKQALKQKLQSYLRQEDFVAYRVLLNLQPGKNVSGP